ncbi:hypothetical protein C7S14_8398 [Burkholderia cepacia]|nr:hypothetical protein C7S14_8398 [Burkholderia cepacia]
MAAIVANTTGHFAPAPCATTSSGNAYATSASLTGVLMK